MHFSSVATSRQNVAQGIAALAIALLCTLGGTAMAWAEEAPSAQPADNGTPVATAEPEGETVLPQEPQPDAELTATDNAVEGPEAPTPEPPVSPFSPVDLEDGDYLIQSALDGNYVLDVDGASKEDGGNVQIYEYNGTDAQKWRLTLEDDGYYSLVSLTSGLYLDLNGAIAQNSQNVWQYTGNGTLAQRWVLFANNGGYQIASAVDPTFLLDVAGAANRNGTNVAAYEANGTLAQLFWFISLTTKPITSTDVADGTYEIVFADDDKYVVDVAGGETSNLANVQAYENNGTNAQRWNITRGEDGYYTLLNINSGKALDVDGAKLLVGSNVQQYESNGTLAQKWAFIRNADGSLSLVSALTGEVLARFGAGNSANLAMSMAGSQVAQKVLLRPCDVLQESVYNIFTALAPSTMVIDVPGRSDELGLQLQLWESNGTAAQKFRVYSLGDNHYALQSLSSKLYLANVNGKLVQVEQADSASQAWIVSFGPDGYLRLTSALDGTALATAAGASLSSTQMVFEAMADTLSQLFRFKATNILEAGRYLFESALEGVMNVAGGDYFNSANVDVAGTASQAQQAWIIETRGDYVVILNAKSYRALDVSGALAQAGTNVQQYASNGTLAQLWHATYGEGDRIILHSALDSNLVLTLSNGNVIVETNTSATAQQWTLTPTDITMTGYDFLDEMIANVWNKLGPGGDLLYKAFDYTKTFRYVSGQLWPSGDFTPQYAWEMLNYGGGNCYRFASLLCWLARSIGYESTVACGTILFNSGLQQAHGWTEIWINGTPYLCDAELAPQITYYSWYMMTYDDAPIYYTASYRV